MRLDLQKFEEQIDDGVILKRGYDYFRKNHVLSIEKVKNNVFLVQVSGTQRYCIHIELSEDQKIKKSSCDCPYDWWGVCKHEVAAYYALREKIYTHEVILDPDNESKEFDKKINPQTAKKIIRSMVLSSIRYAWWKYWYVEWNRVWNALEWAWEAKLYFEKRLKNKKFDEAVIILLTIIEVLIVKLENIDDSDGECWGFIDMCIDELLPKLLQSVKKYETENCLNTMFKNILKIVKNRKIHWWDFEKNIIAVLIPYLDKKWAKDFFQVLVALSDDYGFHSWKKYQLLQIFWSSDDINTFVKKNISNDIFAFDLAQHYRIKKEYLAAEKILLNLIKLYKGRDEWKVEYYQELWRIYKTLKKKNKYQEVMYNILLSDPNLANFLSYKKILWSDYINKKENIFIVLNNKAQEDADTWYPEICLKEKENEKFVQYFQEWERDLWQFDRYFTKLSKCLPQKTYGVYAKHIEEMLLLASNREKYKELCRYIRKMKKIDDKKTQKFVDMIKIKYHKRRALLEELGKIVF